MGSDQGSKGRRRLRWLPELTRNSLAFGLASFSSAILGSIFSLYTTDVFTSVYKINNSHFYASHVAFALWNAVNDPAFAWLIDHTTSKGAERRLPAIKYGGPMWSVAFLIPWWPWTHEEGSWVVGMHYCVSLCAFDSFLTYVLLVHCALLADLDTDNTVRNNYNNVASAFGLVGGVLSAFSYYVYDKDDLDRFRLFCVIAGAVAAAGFWVSGGQLRVDRLDSHGMEGGPGAREDSDNAPLLGSTKSSPAGSRGAGAGPEGEEAEVFFVEFCKQLAGHRNFWLYVAMNFVENFNALFDQSFFVFFDHKLITPTLPTDARAAVISLCLYLPKVMTQVLTPIANKYGTYKLLMGAALAKLAAGLAMGAVGVTAWPVWAALLVWNRLVATVWGFYNLSFSDVIDEDMLRNRRRQSLSVSVHGVQALFVKPAQSLAPMAGVALLPADAMQTDLKDMGPAKALAVRTTAYTLLWAVPVGCGAVQAAIWSAYTLHGKALKEMKERLREWESLLTGKGDLKAIGELAA